jgi:hypothetical protein
VNLRVLANVNGRESYNKEDRKAELERETKIRVKGKEKGRIGLTSLASRDLP